MGKSLGIATLFSLSTLVGCGSHELTFEGRVVDDRGVALQASEISLRDVGYQGDTLVDQEALGGAEMPHWSTRPGGQAQSEGPPAR